ESRVLEKLAAFAKPVSVEQLAMEAGESVALVSGALEALAARGSVVAPAAGRWLTDTRWGDAREQVAHAVAEYAEKHPSRYGIAKGELKNGLKASLDGALFDLAFAALAADASIEQRGERVRPGGQPWEPPAGTLAALERLEKMLEAGGFQVAENSVWTE